LLSDPVFSGLVILAPTRWKLRAAIKVVNQTLAELELAKHPDKTFIGRISKGFDFLGYTFAPSGLGVAAKTVERFAERVSRLYEQGADSGRIGEYVRRWLSWVQAGLGGARIGLCAVGRFGSVLLVWPEVRARSSKLAAILGTIAL
jgi:hypothetical protein